MIGVKNLQSRVVRRRLVLIIGFLILVCVFMAVTAELGLRLAFSQSLQAFDGVFDWNNYNGNYPRWKPNNEIQYVGVPFKSILPPTLIKLNNFGFRGADFSLHEKLPEHILIQCYGDSMTFSIGVEENETIPYQLERNLRANSPLPSVPMIVRHFP